MAKLSRLLRQPEFQLFLFCVFFMLINWPFLSISAERGLISIFIYLLILTSLFILAIFLIQKALAGDSSKADDEGRQ